jgi:hypothetical protein
VPQRVQDRGQVGTVQRGLRVGRRVSGLEQQLVAFPERQAERFGKADDYLAAWCGPAALDEAEVPLRRSGPKRKLKLAHPPGGAAILQRGREIHEPSCSRSGLVHAIPRGELPTRHAVRRMSRHGRHQARRAHPDRASAMGAGCGPAIAGRLRGAGRGSRLFVSVGQRLPADTADRGADHARGRSPVDQPGDARHRCPAARAAAPGAGGADARIHRPAVRRTAGADRRGRVSRAVRRPAARTVGGAVGAAVYPPG